MDTICTNFQDGFCQFPIASPCGEDAQGSDFPTYFPDILRWFSPTTHSQVSPLISVSGGRGLYELHPTAAFGVATQDYHLPSHLAL
jgi:hypothetical protein